MIFKIKGVRIGNLIITTRSRLEHMDVKLNEKDIRKILILLKKELGE